jgi:hypothetical protein
MSMTFEIQKRLYHKVVGIWWFEYLDENVIFSSKHYFSSAMLLSND